ncbi:TraR/DksA family transcriptional regulator [Ramlibacter albus]|uniref:TraR/DksA family transcriptional regulator n=1 Tax=Ramlibacter albus TaxID=2079448 RepID=A0A923M971_9BURK|nr:TraR/DksA family transcriptional regulator [Ramlibacter albus]MBC5766602.1 TraR/DksA family transcriptional regulator [Ramlibacter albus]
MDANLLARTAQALARREAELRLELAAHHDAISHEVDTFEDLAGHDREVALLEALDHRASDELRLVLAARRRMHLGTYGDCIECGGPIADERLLAVPTAARCKACEQRHKAAGDG